MRGSSRCWSREPDDLPLTVVIERADMQSGQSEIMSNDPKEQLSALLDQELDPRQITGASRRIVEDDGLRAVWDRYHLIGDVMRGEGVRIAGRSVADAVRERIQSEPPILAAPRNRAPTRPEARWLKPAAGAALAASVAVVAVYSLPRLTGTVPEGAPLQVAQAPVSIDPETPRRSGTHWKNLAQPQLESRLNRYLVNHSEYASPRGMNGMLPYTSFVGYDTDRP